MKHTNLAEIWPGSVSPQEIGNTQENERWGVFAYMPIVYEAFLGKFEKHLLVFYCHQYTWKTKNASYYSEKSILRALEISRKSYRAARAKLEELGWIHTWHEKMPHIENLVVRVEPLLGRDDPAVLAKYGGRQPKEQEMYQRLRQDFKHVHPDLCEAPTVKKILFPAQNQTARVQKMRLEQQK